MVTDVVEAGTVKSHQYWEKNPGDSVVYGSFKVRTVNVDSHDGYSVSALELTNLDVRYLWLSRKSDKLFLS